MQTTCTTLNEDRAFFVYQHPALRQQTITRRHLQFGPTILNDQGSKASSNSSDDELPMIPDIIKGRRDAVAKENDP